MSSEALTTCGFSDRARETERLRFEHLRIPVPVLEMRNILREFSDIYPRIIVQEYFHGRELSRAN